jgi:hypothetical protein
MAYFVKLGKGSKVERVEKLSNDIAVNEQAGVDFLNNLYKTNDVWKQTSYNTRGGIHYQSDAETPSEDQSKAFRKNYAGIGWKYDQTRDAFIEPQPFTSWVLNETTCQWEAPVAKPDDGQKYEWNEANKNWQLI